MDSSKLTIAVVLDAQMQDGGGFYQQITVLFELSKLDKYNLIVFIFDREIASRISSFNLKTVLLKRKVFYKFYQFLFRQDCFYYFIKKFHLKSPFEKDIEPYDIDIIYFLSPNPLSLDIVSHNYIITVWDLCHRDYPEFPEVNNFREFEIREILYSKSLKKAVAVLVDSEIGKRNIVKRYGIEDSRVYIAPFMPSINSYKDYNIDVKKKYQINGEYIYYPAQFWAHKNHVYIIDAIALLKNQNINITAVFSGSNKGNLNHVLNYANQKGVSDLVKYIGFAPDEDIYSLYKNALALVMPTYFGPTNIPPLEAFAIGTPVIYSDLPSFREQTGDAALYCDLNNPDSLVENLKSLIKFEDLRNDLVCKGRMRLNELCKVNILNLLEKILDDYSAKLKCWKCLKV